jgi:integrase
MPRRRRFGRIRKLPSGRWQARYPDSVGELISAPQTFATKTDADRFLATVETDIARGTWFDPRAGAISLSAYSTEWIANRRVRGKPLAPRTRELYEGLLRRHIDPHLGRVQLRRLDVAAVRRWHATVTGPSGPGAVTAAKAYRLLHAVCATAVTDEQLARNPCVLPGAGMGHSPERPIATLGQVYALADAVPPRFRALILLATFCPLRFGELAALTRERLDLLHRTVSVTVDLDELDSGKLQLGEVKSAAGRRSLAIPEVIVADLEHHLAIYAAPGGAGLVFVGPRGGPLRRGNFREGVWGPATRAVGVEGLHFHDLRHTGNTLAAATGASTRELMARMGHASTRAALIYQHATQERDIAIAAALSDLVTGAKDSGRPGAVPLLRDRAMSPAENGTG